MNQLEKLLNTLLKMGWKPFSESIVKVKVKEDDIEYYKKDKRYSKIYFKSRLRELVSIDSQLWQFVVDKGIFDRSMGLWTDHFTGMEYDNYYYVYRLLESALVPEEDLVEFLLGNINVEGGL